MCYHAMTNLPQRICLILNLELELELELIQTQLTHKPMPRAGVHVRVLRASQNRKEDFF